MTAEATNTRNQRRVVHGRVSSSKGDKTIVVVVERQEKHPKYGKFMRKTSKYHAHDENNEAREGDMVMIQETRRLSKTKCWRLLKVVERAEIVD